MDELKFALLPLRKLIGKYIEQEVKKERLSKEFVVKNTKIQCLIKKETKEFIEDKSNNVKLY